MRVTTIATLVATLAMNPGAPTDVEPTPLPAPPISAAGAEPAEPAPEPDPLYCTGPWIDSEHNIITANCGGGTKMRFQIECVALWPFEPWNWNSAWITVPSGGQTVATTFPTCSGAILGFIDYP